MISTDYEDGWRGKGCVLVAGVDEVGRGPLAGPVMAAAAAVPDDAAVRAELLAGVRDSKALTAVRREALAARIEATCMVHVAAASVDEIDRLNIREATLLAMARAVAGLAVAPAAVLVDGRDVPPALAMPGQAVVKGDAVELCIACASIVAKVARDRLMAELAEAYPGYGWERNAGYGSAVHLAALRELGPTVHHRRSFAPVRALLEQGRVAA